MPAAIVTRPSPPSPSPSTSKATSAIAVGSVVLVNGRLVQASDPRRAAEPESSARACQGEGETGTKEGRRKIYACTWEGCDKVYSKPARLDEHYRVHTGERPFACLHCSNTYRRESHLHAHARTHEPSDNKPFRCDRPACGKRFWTAQHLKRHTDAHDGENAFECPEPNCPESFAKHKQLREHVAEAHSTPGTRPFKCSHEGCEKSFPTGSKLRKHERTHDGSRYVCSLPHDPPSQGPSNPAVYSFRTWTDLQAHLRQAHPPTCPYPECSGRTFTSARGLRGHLMAHEDRKMEEERRRLLSEERSAVSGESEDGEGEDEAKRLGGGQRGRDHVCDWKACDKAFKSAYALRTHVNTAHLGLRPFVCDREVNGKVCGKAFGHKHLLLRHGKLHDRDAAKGVEEAAEVYSDADRSRTNGANDREASDDASSRADSRSRGDSATTLMNGRKRARSVSRASASRGSKRSKVDLLTGAGYAPSNDDQAAETTTPVDGNGRSRSQSAGPRLRVYACPWPTIVLEGLESDPDAAAGDAPISPSAAGRATSPVHGPVATAPVRRRRCETSGPDASKKTNDDDNDDDDVEDDGDLTDPCQYRFSRVYDLRRHLASMHGVRLEDEELRIWLGAPRKRRDGTAGGGHGDGE